ncbi:MAG: VCBS repeat-containing protein [Planctomycetales bacterium]|nr:VCBS repeat-containing protein [Planctomycetales bacterium]
MTKGTRSVCWIMLFGLSWIGDPLCINSNRCFGQQISSWKKTTVYEGARCMTAIAGDFRQAGQTDFFVNAGSVSSFYPGPSLAQVIIDDSPEHNFIHCEAFDIDADGDQDIVGARYMPGLIVWFEHPQDAQHDRWLVHTIDDQVNGIHGLLRADVNRDGKLDLIANSAQPISKFPYSLVWYDVPDDPKKPWNRHVVADGDAPGLTHYMGFGDVNGDGFGDIATGAKGGPQAEEGTGDWFAWWQAPADSTGKWQKHLIATEQPGATNIHPVDVNRDGRMDFIASRGHGVGVIWFEATGNTQRPWVEHSIDATIKEPHSLTIADLDNDGDMDAATCAYGSKLVAWYENDGFGRFQTRIIDQGQEAYDIRAIDCDRDGDLDLVVAGRESNNALWYSNPLINSVE